MLTQCSICGTVFRVHADQLSAARGVVRCGECESQFNALERLIDEPDVPRVVTARPRAVADEPPASAPVFVLLDTGEDESAGVSEVADHPNTAAAGGDAGETTPAGNTAPPRATTAEPAVTSPPVDPGGDPGLAFDFAANAAAPPLSTALASSRPLPNIDPSPSQAVPGSVAPYGPSLSPEAHAVLFTDPGTGEADAFDIPDEFVEDDFDEDVPELIREQVAALKAKRTARSSLGWFWVLAALALTMTLGLQLAWDNRAMVFARIPQTRDWASSVCARVGCDVKPTAEPATIELVARDVRDHPQYHDALLVNATLTNRSDTPRAYPVIQLGLYDRIGNALGIRRFEPAEYLDQSIDLAAGMPPGRPIFIVLEVAAKEGAAVSFEFTFL